MAANKTIVARKIAKDVSVIIGGKLYARQGTNVFIKCPVSGTPTPRVVWEKVGQSEPFQSQDHTLMLTSVDVVDSGMYQCTMVNVLGNATARTELYVGKSQIVAS